MKIYILSGSLASGKGTQANLITKFLPNSVHLSTGELFRSEIKAGTKIGKDAKNLIDNGILISDEITNKMVTSFLDALDNDTTVLLDGYPRNKGQILFLEKYIKEKKHTIEKVILLMLEETIAKKRVLGRFRCKNCNAMYNDFFKKVKKDGICDVCGGKEFYRRESDNEKTIENRLSLYKNTILKALSFYEEKNLVINIDAGKSQSEVFKSIKMNVFGISN